MEELLYVRYANPEAFLEATKDFEDSFMNFCTGTVIDRIAKRKPGEEDELDTWYFSSIFKGDRLLLILANINWDMAWQLFFPCSAQDQFTTNPALLPAALTLIATSTFADLQNPHKITRVMGIVELLNPFIETWRALTLREHKLRVRASPAPLSLNMAYCTRASLAPFPPPEHPSHKHEIIQAMPVDADPIAPLYAAFQLQQWQRTVPHAEAVTILLPSIEQGLLYWCRIDGRPAAFLVLGRSTPRTIAVRNVFVAPEHRRKGVAGAMVRAATRYFLGARPHGISGAVPETPLVGFKEEVTLNVRNDEAERVYRRVGYMLPDRTRDDPTGGFDPISGRNAWLASVSRDLVYEPEPLLMAAQPTDTA